MPSEVNVCLQGQLMLSWNHRSQTSGEPLGSKGHSAWVQINGATSHVVTDIHLAYPRSLVAFSANLTIQYTHSLLFFDAGKFSSWQLQTPLPYSLEYWEAWRAQLACFTLSQVVLFSPGILLPIRTMLGKLNQKTSWRTESGCALVVLGSLVLRRDAV